ncbi:MAG: PepSY-associated TM helix domain-containing protein [Fibrella sp.]|nr:PepSY-associated TM helix domain-containing protein [Armatimonadota bacterium]
MTTRTTKPSVPDAPRDRPFHLKVAALLRWLHIYLSMLSLLLVLFFSATGLTLNHPDWFFSKQMKQTDTEGKLSEAWLAGSSSDPSRVARLEIVEELRKRGVRGALEEFRVDETECLVSFKAPGYAADGYIDRRTGTYRLTTTEEGTVAALNDLHKGRHSGAVWSKVVDISAIFLVVISLTGLGLVFFLKRLRVAALLTVCGGITITLLLIRFFVPG